MVTSVNPASQAVDLSVADLSVDVGLPDPAEKVAYDEAQKRGARVASVNSNVDREHAVGWSVTPEGERVLAIKSQQRCLRAHEAKWERSSCVHNYCHICAGYVDPSSLVVLGKPGPTVWCNRKPLAAES